MIGIMGHSGAGEAGPDAPTEAHRLAAELRRVINQLVLTRPSEAALTAAAKVAREFADQLESEPVRSALGEISEAGLGPRQFIENSPVSGRSNALAPPVQMRVVADDEHGTAIEGLVTFGSAYEGPPGHVHGGWLAAMFDEMLGFAQLSPGFTATLTINYRKPTPLGKELTLRSWVDSADGRKRIAKGTCHVDGQLLCDAQGLFIAPMGTTQEWLARFGLPTTPSS